MPIGARKHKRRWDAYQPKIGDWAVPTALVVADDVRTPFVHRKYAAYVSEEAQVVCDHIADTIEHEIGVVYSLILRGAQPWGKTAEASSGEKANGRRLWMLIKRLDEIGYCRVGCKDFVSLWGPTIALREADCIAAMAASPFESWTTITYDGHNNKVVAAFQLAPDRGFAIGRSGPLVRVDLWRGPARNLSTRDRAGFLTIPEAIAFAYERFNP